MNLKNICFLQSLQIISCEINSYQDNYCATEEELKFRTIQYFSAITLSVTINCHPSFAFNFQITCFKNIYREKNANKKLMNGYNYIDETDYIFGHFKTMLFFFLRHV